MIVQLLETFDHPHRCTRVLTCDLFRLHGSFVSSGLSHRLRFTLSTRDFLIWRFVHFFRYSSILRPHSISAGLSQLTIRSLTGSLSYNGSITESSAHSNETSRYRNSMLSQLSTRSSSSVTLPVARLTLMRRCAHNNPIRSVLLVLSSQLTRSTNS